MTEIKGDIPEIIRLQLRKPTKWGWELSTYKPSRAATLPTIQLYNYKGQLLVEAKDNGETERSWRSSTIRDKAGKESAAGRLKRSKSDTSGRNSSANISRNGLESINRKDGNRQPNNKIKSSDANLDNSTTEATADIPLENGELESKAWEAITGIEEETGKSHNSLKKSKSDGSECKIRGNVAHQPNVYKRNSFQTFQEFAQKIEARHHRRSRSEELLKCRLKSSDESLKRAELDGYINFIKPNVAHRKSQDRLNKSKRTFERAEAVSADNNGSNITVREYKPTRYSTRTSSAGTLIISEESFNDAYRRRRKRNVADTDTGPTEGNCGDGARKSCENVDRAGRLRELALRMSDPSNSISGRSAFNRHPTITENGTLGTVDKVEFRSTPSVTDFNNQQHHGNSENKKSDALPGHIGKYFHNSNSTGQNRSNSLPRRQAFNKFSDIAHSHSAGAFPIINNINISSREKTDPPEKATSKALGFTKYIRPISDPTSWISRKYANIPPTDIPQISWRSRILSNGFNNQGFSSTVGEKHIRQVSDPLSSTSQRCLSYRLSNSTELDKQIRNEVKTATNTSGSLKHVRHFSDPTGHIPGRYLSYRHINIPDTKSQNTKREDDKQWIDSVVGAGLFYSRSAVFLPRSEARNDEIDNRVSDNCNYTVQEPITPSTTSESRKNSGPIIEKLNQSHWKTHGRGSDGLESPDTIQKETRTKGHLINDHSKHKNSGGGDTDLLQLVRRLSSADHVKMGANVSRHSAKGLSGRRSQSSGSICNGKGRHPDGKICSSLPSYLDDRQSNGCNNNHHECEKPPLDEVDRIPPLGDGAPLHWKFSDTQTALCDQGYGSERSPEEEYPPPLPDHEQQCHHHLEPHACYPFITPDSTFVVKLTKGTRGLGLSVTGGIDSNGSWPGLIRIKRLFPHQPASACGLLNVGDLLLQANGITLTGLTNYEALEVLRTAPNQVDLKVCRPPPDVLNCVSPISEVPPPPPRREPPCTLNLSSAIYTTPEDDYYHGEFEVTLKKIHGSLGFTLRKEDDSALGHYVRALVREPALTDGKIKAGDKIIAVNDVEISSMSHEQAVQFLRQCSEVVKLRLYRDSAQTPVAALSPSETTPRNSFSRKAHLRQEAVDMLNDIAVRKLIPGNQDIFHRSLSPNTSPRRLRRQNCPSDASQMTDTSAKYLISDEQFHEGLLQKCSHPFDDDAFNSLFSIESDDGDKPHRPSSLDLYNPNQTPVATRKPRFNFSLAHNAYELNNLDPEVLDAPNLTYNLGNDDVKSTDVEVGDSFLQEPASMPHIPVDNPTFSYKNPAYQSAHPQIGSDTVDSAKTTTAKVEDMKKWKNAVPDASDSKPEIHVHQMPMKEEYEVLAIELNRGWNSRLGFSLQGAAGVTYVSAVHADSVAAKDGRLKPGDRVVKVNDESVEHMTTGEIIDLLRIVRGPVCIVVSRVKSNEDCPKSNAEN